MRRISISTEDRIFSEYIRKRAMQLVGGCERCLTPKYDIVKDDGTIFKSWKQLQCCHFITRGNRATKWDPDNCSGLCGGCHIYLDNHHEEFVDFMVARLGEERFERLKLRAQGVKKMDMVAVRLYLKMLIKGELVRE